ncbi:MAG: prepilin-type N-terminal cleavage/methylation domain-containing protein [Oscillospiraceae bacterium]|jgi:prepilin-type N-terminal cleavage/methylation domain-containing protein|nr:prepilin-type N-terminal cleavage/methylation domain-containing protein [Oscillospiraceae bacterium]
MRTRRAGGNNKGYTLVEIMVVVAILAVALTYTGMSIALVVTTNVRKCANNMNALISQARVNTMYKVEPSVTFRVSGGSIIGDYYEGGTRKESKEMGSAGISVTVEYDGGSFTLTDGGTPVNIAFTRGTGALKEGGSPRSYTKCTAIRLTRGNSAYSIIISPATGKHEIELG